MSNQKACLHPCENCDGQGIIGCEEHEGDWVDPNCDACKEECRPCDECNDGELLWDPFAMLDPEIVTHCESCKRKDVEAIYAGSEGQERYICEACYVEAHDSWHDPHSPGRWGKKE